MSNERETLADIVAEMRTRSREVKEAFGGRPDGVENMLDIWADRIEAAAKREVVSKTETTTVGNAAAMREALDDVLEKIDRWRTDGVMEHWQYSQLFDIADAALAAPPRNCDVLEGRQPLGKPKEGASNGKSK